MQKTQKTQCHLCMPCSIVIPTWDTWELHRDTSPFDQNSVVIENYSRSSVFSQQFTNIAKTIFALKLLETWYNLKFICKLIQIWFKVDGNKDSRVIVPTMNLRELFKCDSKFFGHERQSESVITALLLP